MVSISTGSSCPEKVREEKRAHSELPWQEAAASLGEKLTRRPLGAERTAMQRRYQQVTPEDLDGTEG